jgi:ribonuclease Z
VTMGKITLLVSLALLTSVNAATTDSIKVTLLGTGTPTPRLANFSASTLIEAGSEKLLFDLGRGSTIRLFQKRIPLGAITAHFITHLHSDHIVGLPDMWLSGWVGTPWASRKSPMVVFGPRGTVAMTENLTKAFSEDIRIREDDEHLPPEGIAFDAKDVVPGPVYERNGVKVTAIEVNHGEKIKPAFGYVIEYDGKKVVLSGDTKYDERVANAAKGADLLVHEVAIIEPELVKSYPSYRDIEDHHSSPEDAGRIFTLAKPKLAVYSHLVFATVKPVLDVPEEALIARTRTTYDGPLVVGRDLTSITIDDGVHVFDAKGEPIQPLVAGK